MIVDKIIKANIIKTVTSIILENKDKATDFIDDHKDEVIEKIKEEAKKYIVEHKDKIIEFAKETVIDLIKN